MVSVNKGVWDKATTFEEMHKFNLQWLKECRRLLKPNGTIWVTGISHNIFSVGYAPNVLWSLKFVRPDYLCPNHPLPLAHSRVPPLKEQHHELSHQLNVVE